MAGATIPEPDPGASVPGEHAPARHGFGVEELILATLATLSIAGVAVADYSAPSGLHYWLAMVPVFALASLLAGWARARRHGERVATILRTQALHWVALPLAVYLIYVLEDTGRLNREVAGLVALLTLALTTFLAGVHFDWRLAVLGALLGVAAACAALVEEFFWVLLIPILLAAVAFAFWRRHRARAAHGAA